MSERDVKNFDEDLLKSVFRPGCKDGKFKETMLVVFNKISNCNGHPLSTSIQSMKENYTQMFNKINPRQFDNKQIVSTITEVATLASAEMLFAFYFRFELQSKKYMTSDLREVLNINRKIFPPKYPCDDTMFINTIDELNKLEKSNSVDAMRECLVNSQTILIEDVKAMHNNELPKNFDSDDLLSLLSFSLLYSSLKHPFGVSLMLECFLTEDDFLTQAGYSLTSFTVSIQSIIKMTESEGSMNKELLNNDPVEMLSRQTHSATIVCRKPPNLTNVSSPKSTNSCEFTKPTLNQPDKSKERKTHLRIGSRNNSTTSPTSPINDLLIQGNTLTTQQINQHKSSTSYDDKFYTQTNGEQDSSPENVSPIFLPKICNKKDQQSVDSPYKNEMVNSPEELTPQLSDQLNEHNIVPEETESDIFSKFRVSITKTKEHFEIIVNGEESYVSGTPVTSARASGSRYSFELKSKEKLQLPNFPNLTAVKRSSYSSCSTEGNSTRSSINSKIGTTTQNNKNQENIETNTFTPNTIQTKRQPPKKDFLSQRKGIIEKQEV
ncbi:VPS9 domain-containing protein [Entamoeba marina]